MGRLPQTCGRRCKRRRGLHQRTHHQGNRKSLRRLRRHRKRRKLQSRRAGPKIITSTISKTQNISELVPRKPTKNSTMHFSKQLVAVLSSALLLGACGNNSDTKTAPAQDTTAAAPATAPASTASDKGLDLIAASGGTTFHKLNKER